MAQAIFKSWFVDFEPFQDVEFVESELGLVPKGWKVETLDQNCVLIAKGITPKCVDDSEQIVINQKCIRDNKINLSLARRHQPRKINDKWLQIGDVLINSTGTGTLGRAAQVIFKPINLVVDSHITIVRPKTTYLRVYLGLLLLGKQSEFEGMASGSTGQTDLPRERLKAMQIIIPLQSVLEKFSMLIMPLLEQQVALQLENETLSTIRDTLLPKLMSGEINVSVR